MQRLAFLASFDPICSVFFSLCYGLEARDLLPTFTFCPPSRCVALRTTIASTLPQFGHRLQFIGNRKRYLGLIGSVSRHTRRASVNLPEGWADPIESYTLLYHDLVGAILPWEDAEVKNAVHWKTGMAGFNQARVHGSFTLVLIRSAL